MKVAMVSEHASPLASLGGVDAGGQNVHVAALGSTLAAAGAEVSIYTRRDDPGLPRRVEMRPGLEVVHVDAGPPWPVPKDDLLPHMEAFGDVLRSCWLEDRPDVVHSHFWMSGLASLAACETVGVPLVHTFHALGVVKRRYQGDDDSSPPERLESEREIVRRADRIVATSTDEVFELIRMGADGKRLTVIPCGVDLRLFGPDGPAEPRPARRARLLCVGRLVERKGVGNVISALASLPDVDLVIAGGPPRQELAADPEARRLHALAEEHQVIDRVDLRGSVLHKDLPPLIRSADALVTVPWYEPFGITPLEAMACGVPVVASAVGGLIDTVVDRVTGIHVAPRDPERLAQALASFLGDADQQRAYGRAGVRRARRLYDWDRVGAGTLDVYASLISGRTGKGRRAGAFSHRSYAHDRVVALRSALDLLEPELERVDEWGERLAELFRDGHRLLTAGNGGSAAEAQHLSAELVGRFSTERAPLSAICLHADTSTYTAIANDYGLEQAFARQVRAHGEPGDVLLVLSTSGRSQNLLAAVDAANEIGLTTWAFTGQGPNPLAERADDAVCMPTAGAATVQELHLLAIHVLCAAVDRRVTVAHDPAIAAWEAPR
jgi:glycosyltransferase involved in cell wall biosynthesis/phosphoheptose isomerase